MVVIVAAWTILSLVGAVAPVTITAVSSPASANAARITIVSPVEGALVEIPRGKESTQVQAVFEVFGGVGIAIGQGGVFLHVRADGDQVVSNFFEPMSYVQLVKLEPGTHTVSMQLRLAGRDGDDDEMRFGAGSTLLAAASTIFDVVLPTVPLFFPPPDYDRYLGLAPPRPFVGADGFEAPIRVGVIASMKMDGQKTIWLEQFRHFPRAEYSFRFICFTANQANDGKMVRAFFEKEKNKKRQAPGGRGPVSAR